jgi:hypothetical protein
MTCAEFQEILPELMEDTRRADLEAHTASCSACAELVSDLETIISESKTLRAAEEPSPRVWNSIEIALRQEGLIRAPRPNRPYLVPALGKKWGLTGWLVPAMAILAISAGILFMRSERNTTDRASADPRSMTSERAFLDSPANKVLPAEATEADDNAVIGEVQKRSPSLASVYSASLHDVNTYIHDAKLAVDQDPNDADAREDLLQAYQQKNMLYDMALERSLP